MRAVRLKVGLDTSCLVPLLSDEHADHEATRAQWDRLRRADVQLVVSCHALLECFSVLTRMPPPYRRPAEEAERLLQKNFAQGVEIPGFGSELMWSCIRELVSLGVGGGRIYDAVIARSTFAAGAAVLLTWNVGDFLAVAPAGLEILTPSNYSARASRVH